MKRPILLLICLALLLSAPLSLAAEKVTLNVANWGDYMDPDVLALFESRTGIGVNYEVYESNEDVYTKLKKANASYDVIFPSDYMVQRMVQEKMLLPLNFEHIPQAAQIDPRFVGQGYDPEGLYSLPYTWGTMGILYNTTKVKEAPTSWAALWDGQYAGEILMINIGRETLGITLKSLGYSLNTVDPDQLAQAKQRLIDQSPLVLAYVLDEVKDKMIAGEAALAMVWSGDANYCMNQNPDLAYVVPQEGSNIFFDTICVPASAKHQVEAEMFINFLCEPEIAKMNHDYVGYAIPNQGAIALMDETYLASPVNNPPQEVLDRCELLLHLGNDVKLYDKIWTEIITSL